MNKNLTANSFADLSVVEKLSRIVAEPGKAYRESLYRFFSVFGHKSFTPFVILTRDRTGSNMLVQYLNSHPSIRCNYEMLATLKGKSGPATVKSIYSKQPFTIKARGFKVFYYHPYDADQAAIDETWTALQSIPGLRLIHLRRLNVLETAVSSKVAYQSGVYGDLEKVNDNKTHTIPLKNHPLINYAPENLEAVFKKTSQWEEQYPKKFANCPSLETTYEALVSCPEVELGKICTFLGCDSSLRLSTNFRKQRTKSLRSIVQNYDELKKYFEGSRWSQYFTE